jgi:DNA-binding NarL/FixJ family response regulator
LQQQVASQFGTTEGTIKVHRGRVMEKMGATSVAELVILAQKAGIAPSSADATKV